MYKFSKNIFILFVVAVFILPIFADNAGVSRNLSGKMPKVSQADKRKAEYIFLEAQRLKSLGRIDDFYQYLLHAYNIDPTNSTVAYYLGFSMLTMDNPDDNEIGVALSLMSSFQKEHPSEYFENYFFGDACFKLGLPQQALDVWNDLVKYYPSKPELFFQMADSYTQLEDYDKAYALYDSVESAVGPSVSLALRKISLSIAKNDTLGAINEARKQQALAPSNPDYLMLIGNIFLKFQMQDSAMVYYNKAQAVDPSNGYAYMAKANVYNMTNDSVNYEKQIYNALVCEELPIEEKTNILTDFIRDQFHKSDSTKRINKLFDVLIEQNPHEPSIHDLYSEYLVARHDYPHAAEQLSYVLDLDPTNSDNWMRLIYINMMNSNFDEAITNAEKALEYKADTLSIYKALASSYSQTKMFDKAIDSYNKALCLADSSDFKSRADILGGMADTYFTAGDTIKSFELYKESIELMPGNMMVLNNYAYFLAVANQNLDEAERMSAITVNSNSNSPTFLDTYAFIYFRKGEYKLALTYIKAAVDNSDEPSSEIFEHYGDILFMNGDPDNALVYWKKALELSPDSDLLKRKVKNKTYFFK